MKSPRWHIVINTRAVSILIIRRNQMALEKIGRVAIHSDVFVERWWDTAGSWGRGLIPSDVAGQFPKDCRWLFFSGWWRCQTTLSQMTIGKKGGWGRGLIHSDVLGQFPKDCRWLARMMSDKDVRWEMKKMGGWVWSDPLWCLVTFGIPQNDKYRGTSTNENQTYMGGWQFRKKGKDTSALWLCSIRDDHTSVHTSVHTSDHACVHTSDHTDHTRDHSMIIILVFIPVTILVTILALDLELCLGNQVSVSCCQRDDN